MTVACATEGAAIEYKLSNESAWKTYSTGIATASWPNGRLVLNLRASKAGMGSRPLNVTYNVTA